MSDITKFGPGPMTCQGPREEDLPTVIARLRDPEYAPVVNLPFPRSALESFADLAESISDQVGIHTVSELISYLFQIGEHRVASALSVWSRKGCGYDLRELFAQFPIDGKEHSSFCPQCGRYVEWRAPLPG